MSVANQLTRVRLSVLGQMLTSSGIVVLAVLLYVVLSRVNRILALVALGWWLAEAITLALIQLGVLALIPLSLDFVRAGAPGESFYQGLGQFLYYGMAKQGMTIHMWFYCIGGLLWYAMFFRSRYIPRVISLWGLVAVVLALGAAAFQLFGYAVPLWVSIPIAPFELAIGFWLLLKGIKAGSETSRPLREPMCRSCVLGHNDRGGTRVKTNDGPEAFAELERGVHAALETYANVHRGSGHNSLVSTHLYEQAREIVLEHLGLNKEQVRGHLLLTPKGGGAQGATRAGKLPQPVKPGHRPAAGCQGLGRRPQGAAQRRAVPDRRRDGQARLPRLGHLGQGAGQIRGRHARDRQRHRVCRGAAADPAFRKGRFPGCVADAGRSRRAPNNRRRRNPVPRRSGEILRARAVG